MGNSLCILTNIGDDIINNLELLSDIVRDIQIDWGTAEEINNIFNLIIKYESSNFIMKKILESRISSRINKVIDKLLEK